MDRLNRRTLLKVGFLVPAVNALPPVAESFSPAAAAPHITRTLARDIDVPWSIVFLPSGDALVSERDTGRILRVRTAGGRRAVGHVPGVVSNASQGGEGGLLGLALHPNFRANRWLYAYLSTGSDNRWSR